MTSRVQRTLALLTAFVLLIGVGAPGLTLASTARASSKASTPAGAASRKAATAKNSKSTPAKSTAAKSLKPPTAAPSRSGSGKAIATKTTSKKRATLSQPQKSPSRTNPTIKGTGKNRVQVRQAPARGRKSAGKNGRAALTTVQRSSRNKRATPGHAPSNRYAPRFFDPARPQTLRAEAAVVVDTRTMKVVWAKNPHERRPVASLTKLMTALVFMDHDVPLTDSMTVTMADVQGAGRSHVRAGNRVAVGDLFRCSLISSDNCATRVLARSTGLSGAEFVAAMNAKARALGLRETHYADPTGLDPNNLSTASDQARLIILAADNPLIGQITSSPSYTFLCGRRIESLTNTNRLLRTRSDIVGSKTGYINKAGYCVAMLIGDRDNPYLTTVILGAPSNASRFAESSKLIEWALSVVGPSPAMASPNPSGTAPAPLNQPNRR